MRRHHGPDRHLLVTVHPVDRTLHLLYTPHMPPTPIAGDPGSTLCPEHGERTHVHPIPRLEAEYAEDRIDAYPGCPACECEHSCEGATVEDDEPVSLPDCPVCREYPLECTC